ncbi:MAG: GDP-mannose 4,6-dehydratase [Candidatus Omnitrophica bacterium]|nr:GDP-mannose 4,6-dehydratase [Candidatus Omnitrophota bacterium]
MPFRAPTRVMITGATGFVGRHLAEALIRQGAEVVGLSRRRTTDKLSLGPDRPRWVCGDLHDEAWLSEVLRAARPTHVFHLAGVLPGAPGGAAAQYEANVLLTVQLLEAIHRLSLNPWIMVASSSAVYGDMEPNEPPLSEDRPFQPRSHYAVSKAAQELAALSYTLMHRLRTVRVRSFNLIGPGQPNTLLTSHLAYQVAQARAANMPRAVRVGNLFPRRDYVDVRDAVRAYQLLAEHETEGVFNVCSGRSVSVQECVDLLARCCGEPLQVLIDQDRVRPQEISIQVGDPQRLHRATGWTPARSLEESLRDLLAYWSKTGP